jgi:predicted nucleic acid-binding protein
VHGISGCDRFPMSFDQLEGPLYVSQRHGENCPAHLSLADAFAAATAITMDASLVTGDPEFRSVANLVEIQWL